MKKTLCFISLLFAVNAMAQMSAIPAQANEEVTTAKPASLNNSVVNSVAPQVTSAVVYASPGYAAGCNNSVKHFEFTAVITTNGPCVVQYGWERNDGARDSYAPHSITFTAAGTQTVSTTWDISRSDYEGWQAINISAPNRLISNKAPFKIICCAVTPPALSRLSPCTQALLRSFQNIVTRTGTRICNPTTNAPSVSSTMPISCFSNNDGSPGVVSYTAFFYPDPSQTFFRVIWGGEAGNFTYYGVCPPEPIVFPLPSIQQNHVFAAKLVRVSDYQSLPVASRTYDGVEGIHPSGIVEIINPRLEGREGFIATNETASYNNLKSSKGIIVTVRLSKGMSAECYILNNYDGAGTLTWKNSVD
jgi:hypothetical protein